MKEKVNDLKEKAGHAIRENVAHIIFGAVVLLMIFLSFVDMGKGDGAFDWFGFCVNLTLQLSVFIPYRWRQKRITGQTDPYKQNQKDYGEKVDELHKNNELKQFAEFCQVKTDELKRAKQLAIVHAAGIDTKTFDFLTDRNLTEQGCKQRDQLRESLTEAQRKAFERALRVKVKPVNPLSITSNSNRVRGYGIDFNEEAEDCFSIFQKVMPMFLWSGIITYIVIAGIHYGGIAAVVIIIFRIVMCLTAMFSGIMSGDGFVVKKDKVILRRIDFLELFHEWKKMEEKVNAS